jgi:hypothetical protein
LLAGDLFSELNDDIVVYDAVDGRGGSQRIFEHLRLLGIGQVGGDHHSRDEISSINNLNRSKLTNHTVQMTALSELNGYIIHQKDRSFGTESLDG